MSTLPPLLVTAALLELFGGALVLIGAFVRPIAFLLSGEMAVAYFLYYFGKGIFPLANGGELAALYCFAFLYLSIAGAGAFSVDEMRQPTKIA